MRADLKIGLHADKLTPYLRADGIRYDTLVALAAALMDDPDNDLINRLHELGHAVTGHPGDGEIDALIGDVEDLADMGRAQMTLTRDELRQLAREAADACNALTPALVPQQREGGAAA
jgi:hypothetical protein